MTRVSVNPAQAAPHRGRIASLSERILARSVARPLALLVLPVAVAAATVLRGGSLEQVFGFASIAGIPLMTWASVSAPEALVGTIVFAQIVEQFELATPAGTISPGSIALIVFLLVRLPNIVATMRRPGYAFATLLVCAYVAGHLVQFLHVPPYPAARQMVTAGGFAGFALLGMFIGSRRAHLAAAGAGAAAGLLTLGILAIVANVHPVHGILDTYNSRAIFAFTSPFLRSLGLRSDTAGLLLALAVPWLAYLARFGGRRSIWIAAVSTLALIELASLLLFQSRSMVLEGIIGSVMVWGLADRQIFSGGAAESLRQAIDRARQDRRTVMAARVAVAGLVGIVVLGLYLAIGNTVNGVSTQLRADSYTETFHYFAGHPWAIIFGTDPVAFHHLIDATLYNPTVSHISENAPVHNFIVETLVAGGIVAAGSLVLLSIVPFLRIARNQLVAGRISPAAAMAMAAVAVAVIEASVTPAIANSGALWIALGCGVAAAAPAVVRTARDEASMIQEDRAWLPWPLPRRGAPPAVVAPVGR